MENEIGLSRVIVLSPAGPLLCTKVFSGDVSVRPAVPDLGGVLKRHYISDQHLHSTTFSPTLPHPLVCSSLREYFFMAKVSSGSWKTGAETVD